MPRPKTAKTERTCLVCGGTTNVAHLGLDICRACTVFYRRSRDRKFACRSTTNRCPIGDGVNCRKCRLAEMERMLNEQPNSRARMVKIERASTTSPVDEQPPAKHEEEDGEESDHAEEHHSLFCSPSTSASVPQSFISENDKPQPRELLEKLRTSYRSMCETRLAGELANRNEPPHPLSVVDGTYAIAPATYGTMEIANRLFLSALLQFGASAFPEFAAFDGKHRWTIVTNFFTKYRMFESSYRADRAFETDMAKTFAGYTMYFSPDIAEHFFDDCPNEGAFREDAKRAMDTNMKTTLRGGRTHMRRINLRHEEFLAVLGVMFWTTDGLELSEDASRISQGHRERILKELHSYYREELQMNDYASRLGELLMMLQIYEQRAAGLDQHFEMMRLLNVFNDNTLIYRLAPS
ncbi:hypothetical protein PRIPAC_78448 [Pristionchus pacificus]|uniref:Nuclear receptor n=1 Tax=Pristionchus pacificus TaxID=54126 RepID=A0A8R1Z7T4_PRIPA|nr:hypothetical protein PRIPAC_78448 [Pristionchus pacificus]